MFKVVIDPGHGGSDRANRGPTGYIEADGVLAISKYLRDELLKTGQFDVKLTRDKDATLGLTERGNIAGAFKADLFLSEHTNASGKPYAQATARGTDVYYSVDIPADKDLALKMAAAVSATLGIPNRGAHVRESTNYPGEDYYTVIDTAQDNGVPHVLLCESAFHDNAQDEAILKVDANLKKIAVAQAKVICDLFKVVYPPVAPTAKHPIMGTQVLKAEQLDAFVRKVNPTAPALAALFLKYGAQEGVRGDIAFCQSIKETNYFRYGGDVKPEQNNYAGIGTTGGGVKGAYFKTPDEGVLAQIQHLKAYASKDALNSAKVDPRFDLVTRGIAPNWEDLNGRWAVPGTTYGQDIIKLYENAAKTPMPMPPKPSVTIQTPQNCTLVLGSPVTIVGAGVNCHHIGIFVDGAYVTHLNGNNVNYGYIFTTPGTHTVQLKGRNTESETEYGTVLAESAIVTVKVLAPKVTIAATDIPKVNEAIKFLDKYFTIG